MKQPPTKIYLQWHGDAHPIERGEASESAVTLTHVNEIARKDSVSAPTTEKEAPAASGNEGTVME